MFIVALEQQKSRNNSNAITEEKTVTLVTIFFDLALVPNILVNNSLINVFMLVTLRELGLVYTKLVFSISYKEKGAALA